MTGDGRSAADPSLGGRIVLVIEDHPDSRDLLVEFLRSLHARALSARNIAEAELQIALYRPHLIVCDMKLPDGTGFQFVEWLRRQSKPGAGTTPCIAITGYEEYSPVNAEIGFNAYLRKPIDLDRFRDLAVALTRHA